MRITLDELKNVKTFKEHEEGIYTVRIVNAKEGVSKNTGTEFLEIEVETMNDDSFKVRKRYYNSEKALLMLLNLLSAIGFYEDGKMVEFNPDDLLGSILEVELIKGEETEQGKRYLEIKPYSCKSASQTKPKTVKKEVVSEDNSDLPF